MTELRKPVHRRTKEGTRSTGGRRIVVTLAPGDVIGVREERTRTTLYVPIEKVYQYAARLAADAKRAERKLKKKGKK